MGQTQEGVRSFVSVTFRRRRHPESVGLKYSRELSFDLHNWSADTALPDALTFIDDQWERVTFNWPIDAASQSLLFYRIKVEYRRP
jgi:hypothetical protein